MLDQEGGGAQLLNVHLQGLVRNEVLGDFGGVLVDLVCQLLRGRATVLTIVPVCINSSSLYIHRITYLEPLSSTSRT